MTTMYTNTMKKVSVEWAYEELERATNNGQRAELYTIINYYITHYNPTLAGSLGGDVYGPTCGHMQVKYFNGILPNAPQGLTGDKKADTIASLMHDASPVWVIWIDKDFTTYIEIPKEDLLKILTGRQMEDLVYYNDRGEDRTLRLKTGWQKRKLFMKYLKKNKARGF